MRGMSRLPPLASVAVLGLVCLSLPPLPAVAQLPAPAALTVSVPGPTVTVTLSPKASQTLLTRKETIIVAAYLWGFPKPGTSRKYIDGMGQVDLGDFTVEILPGREAAFRSFAINRDALTRLDRRGSQLLINVYSGRKSSPNNLIDCGIYEGPLKDVENKSIPISCKMIGE